MAARLCYAGVDTDSLKLHIQWLSSPSVTARNVPNIRIMAQWRHFKC